MTPRASLPFLFAFVLLTLTWTRAASADSPPVSWSITGPAACGADVQRVHDEMVLACAAAGGCRLGAPMEATERRAVITCGAEAWKIAAKSDDAELWDMRLDGPADDRARQAAVWLARSEREGSGVPPAPSAAIVEDTSAAVHVASTAHSVVEEAAAPAAPTRRELATGVEFQTFQHQRHVGGGFLWGINGAWAFPLGRRFSLGPALGLLYGYFYGDEGRGNARDVTIFRPAARLSWGAPTENQSFGASLDLGTWLAVDGSSRRFAAVPYVQPSIFVQWGRGNARPYVALNAMLGLGAPDEIGRHTSEAFGPFGMGIAAGASWSAR